MGKIETIKQHSNSYLTFKLGKEYFATHIAYVNQIVEVKEITEIPNSVSYVKGIINQTGKAIPIIDARIKFGMSAIELTVLSSILIMEVEIDGKEIQLGLLVDSVQEVAEIEHEMILPTPSISVSKQAVNYVDGIANLKDVFTMILNVEQFFSTEDELISKNKKQILTQAS